MLHLDADTKYFGFQGAADFRKGFNGLCGLVKEYLQTDAYMVASSFFSIVAATP
jgi:hypothetical protein